MIDYKVIDDSLKYYEKLGYSRVESPWFVSGFVESITKPKDGSSYNIIQNNKFLVASGEQSFLEMYMSDSLPKGKFMTVTPCFRNEELDWLHKEMFIKNELIRTDVVTQSALEEMIDNSFQFFKGYFQDVEIKQEGYGFDITIYGNELGSYGIRDCPFLEWIYGTGCAEPRLSTLIKKYGK